jgi:hypothetical protein
VQLIGQLCNKPPSVAISAFIESVLSVLLRLILSSKVVPPSFEALKITADRDGDYIIIIIKKRLLRQYWSLN